MIKERLGKRIKELRTSMGLSQEKFALSINMENAMFQSQI